MGRKTEIAKGIAIAGVALILFPAQVLCALPTAVTEDLSHLQVLRVFNTIQSMPKGLQHALARTFQQQSLSMANPTQNLRNEITPAMEPEHSYPHRTKNGERIIVGPVNPSSPDRRLLFGFETSRFFYIYYQQAHPSNAACLVFAKIGSRKKPPLLWGGADIRMPSYEQTPEQLRTRILKNRLDDSKNFFW